MTPAISPNACARRPATCAGSRRTAAALVGYHGHQCTPAGSSAAALEEFAGEARARHRAALEAFSERLDRIAELKPPFWADAVFSAEAGRRFEYYDGFVFELAREAALDRPIVSGGRYDGLITRLSGGKRTRQRHRRRHARGPPRQSEARPMTRCSSPFPPRAASRSRRRSSFADAGFRIEPLGGARGYFARIPGLPDVEVRLLSASEIAAGVIAGDIHAGVSGEDLLREQAGDLERVAHLLAPLGFGRADLVVAAPKSWLDVETMADVDDVAARMEARTGRKLRVATKYVRSTRRFFTDEGVGHYRIVESAGATEGAPAAGVAELVVDITTTGATLDSNGLKILHDGVILRSQAQLVASLAAAWSPAALAAARAIYVATTANLTRAPGRFERFESALKAQGKPSIRPIERYATVIGPRARFHAVSEQLRVLRAADRAS